MLWVKSQVGSRHFPSGCWRWDPGASDTGRPKVGILTIVSHPVIGPESLALWSVRIFRVWPLPSRGCPCHGAPCLVSGREKLSREFCVWPQLAEMGSYFCQLEEAHASIVLADSWETSLAGTSLLQLLQLSDHGLLTTGSRGGKHVTKSLCSLTGQF